MSGSLEAVLQEVGKKYADSRFHVFDVQAAEQGGGAVSISGRVLDGATRQTVLSAVRAARPGADLDDRDLRVLRQPGNQVLSVATNLTNLQGGPGWLNELLSQVMAGQRLELLEKNGRWGFVRQADGYLGWAYLPYLTRAVPLPATHIVTAPVELLLDRPETGNRVGRVLGGTQAALLRQEGDWAQISVFDPQEMENPSQIQAGWMPAKHLRPLDRLPVNEEERRQQIINDAITLIGTPYLWGGSSANGIDCSGYAQLLHRWLGIAIPRDADLQCEAGITVEPPFQPGDLLFFGEPEQPGKVTHVTVSVGGWEVIHSSRRRNGVYFDDAQALDHLREGFIAAKTFFRSR